MDGWRDGLGPWTPVRRGRPAVRARRRRRRLRRVRQRSPPSRRCRPPAAPTPAAWCSSSRSEESGSPDLPAYIEALADRIGTPSLVVCLDSGCVDYERLWVTTSLRGLAGGTLKVDIARPTACTPATPAAWCPSTFRIARQLLDRVEDAETGAILLARAPRRDPATTGSREAPRTAADDRAPIADHFPFVERRPADDRRSGRAAAGRAPGGRRSASTGADGLPGIAGAGNVLRPTTSLKLSFRLPPTCDPAARARRRQGRARGRPALRRPRVVQRRRERARLERPGDWRPGSTPRWSRRPTATFGQPTRTFGEGGSIPFMGMLGERFPEAQFVITGVLGPDSERPRPERVPPPADRAAHHDGDGASARRHTPRARPSADRP